MDKVDEQRGKLPINMKSFNFINNQNRKLIQRLNFHLPNWKLQHSEMAGEDQLNFTLSTVGGVSVSINF